MRHNHAQDDAIEGFDESELPAMGPGGIAGAHDRKLAPPPPRLCEVGPCVHYHRFAIQLDAEGPKAASVLAGGKLEGPPPEQPFHIRVHHYCYPDVGIETELGSTPVMQCNRWSPMPPSQAAMIATRNSEFFANDPRGQKYVAEMQAWESARDELEADAEDPIATWVTTNLRDGDYLDVCEPELAHREVDAEQPCDGEYGCGAAAGEACSPPTMKESRRPGDPEREVPLWSSCPSRPRKPGTGHYPVVESFDADTARAYLTTSYLKERYGIRSVRLEILRPQPDESPELVQTITVEVQ
jgi:hypothetical protein